MTCWLSPVSDLAPTMLYKNSGYASLLHDMLGSSQVGSYFSWFMVLKLWLSIENWQRYKILLKIVPQKSAEIKPIANFKLVFCAWNPTWICSTYFLCIFGNYSHKFPLHFEELQYWILFSTNFLALQCDFWTHYFPLTAVCICNGTATKMCVCTTQRHTDQSKNHNML